MPGMDERAHANRHSGRGAGFRSARGLAAAVALAACAPALDWREVRMDEAGLLGLFPCRPVAQTRELALAGRPVAMTLRACESGGGTFAVAVADAKDPVQVGLVMDALRSASTAKQVEGAAPGKAMELAVSGATPRPEAGRWVFQGRRADGAALQVDTAVFARGTWVVQATVIGPVDASAFFEGLRFGP